MFKRAILVLSAFCFIIVIGCSASGYVPGTGGKKAAQKIERTGHPSVPEGVNCYVCHKNDLPTHEFHRKFGRDCSTCHAQTMWMASKYPHEKWPLTKNHTTRCSFCHPNLSSFDFSYQCWGCHHKKAETKAFHEQKGKHFSEACVTCHKIVKEKEPKSSI